MANPGAFGGGVLIYIAAPIEFVMGGFSPCPLDPPVLVTGDNNDPNYSLDNHGFGLKFNDRPPRLKFSQKSGSMLC